MHKFKKKEYEKGDLTVIWDMPKCIHSEKCWRGLGEVFRRNERPWIYLDGADQERILEQLEQCPSGALSYKLRDMDDKKDAVRVTQITLAKDGPALLSGKVLINYPDGKKEEREGNTALCRCGASASKPFCDGSHSKIDFQG